MFDHANLPCLMAGGLNPENVARAIQIGSPLGVDVSSSLENGTPGVKDVTKIISFIRASRSSLFPTRHASIYEEEEDETN